MTLAAIRSGLTADLETVSGLNVVDHLANQVQPPAAFIDAFVIEYENTFDGTSTVTIPVVVLASTADRAAGQDALDELFPLVRAAISHTLGGAAHSTRTPRAERYGDIYEVGGLAFIGGTLIVEIYSA